MKVFLLLILYALPYEVALWLTSPGEADSCLSAEGTEITKEAEICQMAWEQSGSRLSFVLVKLFLLISQKACSPSLTECFVQVFLISLSVVTF